MKEKRRTAELQLEQKPIVAYKWALEGKASSNSEGWVQTAEDCTQQHQLSNAHIHWKAGEMPTKRSETLSFSECTKSTESLLSCLQTALCWRFYKP